MTAIISVVICLAGSITLLWVLPFMIGYTINEVRNSFMCGLTGIPSSRRKHR